MYISSKFAVYATRLVMNAASPDLPEEPHLPDEPSGGRLPVQLTAAYGTDSRPRYNGTGTAVAGTNTLYYWPI
jgi:hypothetical protein